MAGQRRSYTAEFKLESANLVLDQSYCIAEASRSINVNDNALRRWIQQLKNERNGHTPANKALTPEQL